MSTANTKTNGHTEECDTKPIVSDNMKPLEELRLEYVKHENGAIFHVLAHPRKAGKVYLYSKNKYTEYDYSAIENGKVKGTWSSINIHELRQHLKAEEQFKNELSLKIVKRIILTQIMLELDDELKEMYADDKYLRGILERSEKVFLRVASEEYTKLYNVDKDVLNTFFDGFNGFITQVAKLGVVDFVHANNMMKLFLSDPEKYRAEFVEMEVTD